MIPEPQPQNFSGSDPISCGIEMVLDDAPLCNT